MTLFIIKTMELLVLTKIKKNKLSTSFGGSISPTEIIFANGNTIEYLYDVAGVKLQKRVTQNRELTTTDYLDGYQYVDGKLEFYPHAEGYVKVKDDNALQYVYNYTDNLGNVRLSYTQGSDGKAQVVEESNYYPFGLKHTGYNNNSNTLTDKYKYGYNGKEEQDELGLGWIDYQARNYDPALGRWMNMDPLAEKYNPISPYSYVGNNPINMIDPDGKDFVITMTQDEDGNISIEISTTIHVYGEGVTNGGFEHLKKATTDLFNNQTAVFTNEDGSTINIGFNVNFEHHDSEESAVNAVENSPGDNLLRLDKGLMDLENPNWSLYENDRENIHGDISAGGITITGGREGHSRAIPRNSIHEIGHFFGLNDKYEGTFPVPKEGYKYDLMQNQDTPTRIDKTHYQNLNHFIMKDYQNKTLKIPDTRVYSNIGRIPEVYTK